MQLIADTNQGHSDLRNPSHTNKSHSTLDNPIAKRERRERQGRAREQIRNLLAVWAAPASLQGGAAKKLDWAGAMLPRCAYFCDVSIIGSESPKCGTQSKSVQIHPGQFLLRANPACVCRLTTVSPPISLLCTGGNMWGRSLTDEPDNPLPDWLRAFHLK